MSYKNLILRYQLPLSEITPEDEYWLIIEQVVEDERATIGFVADTIDALFDTTLCVESQDEEPTVPEEPVTPDSFEDMDEVLDKISEKTEVDMSACEMLRSGTYQTDLKVIRSHPDVPYTLRLSVGKIIETVLSSKQVSVNQNVKNESSIILPFPAQTGLRVSWLGQVIGKNGVITPPAIQALGNTLFWGVEVTGSLRAEFGTLYDLVTVEIPGIPNYVGSELGESQSANVLAFYHYHVYRADINPPEVDEDLLEEVCGYSTSTGAQPDEDPEPEPPPEPVIQYGCIDYFPLAPFGSPVTEPWFFREKCCIDGQHDGCRVRTSRIEGGKKLSEEIINRMTLEWPGPIEFIGLGPITPAGCGTRYEETVIRPKNCCEDATPIVWDSENSVEVLADFTSGLVFVSGGIAPYYWKIRGQGMTFDGHVLRDAVTDAPFIRVYAGEYACGWCPITVTDNCSVANNGIRSTNGEWVKIAQYAARGGNDLRGLLEQCYGGGVAVSGFYMGGPQYDGSESMLAGKYWVGSDTLYHAPYPPEVGVKFEYVGAIQTYGVPEGSCLAGCTCVDPIAGIFETILATHCANYAGYTWSRTLNNPLRMYEWRC